MVSNESPEDRLSRVSAGLTKAALELENLVSAMRKAVEGDDDDGEPKPVRP